MRLGYFAVVISLLGCGKGTDDNQATNKTPPHSTKPLHVVVKSSNYYGVVSITISNQDSFDWHNVKVCVNEQWCAETEAHGGSPSTDRTIKATQAWSLNWFMQNSIAYRDAVRAGE